jgi:Ca-activated chloride channel family protein
MFKFKAPVIYFVCLLLSSVFAHAAIHEKVSRTFTSNEGREITAQLDGYNPISKEVILRMGSGQKYELPIDRFSKQDQVFILEWHEDYLASFVRVDFFTNRIDGGRIVFMLDSSGSMTGDRWEKMIRNMVEVINRMDKHAKFNIILFGSSARAFSPDLIFANEDSKMKAARWLRSMQPGGGTNLLSAIKSARSMKKAEVYAILSDGYPSGEVMDIYDAIMDNRKANGRMIRVFGVSYQSSARGQEFMEELSDRFEGNYARR